MSVFFFLSIIIVLLLVVLVVVHKRTSKDELVKGLESKMDEIYRQAFKDLSQQQTLNSNQQLKAERQIIKTDLENKQKLIQDIVREAMKKIESAEKDRINKFSALSQLVKDHQRITEQLSVSTESLKKVLSNNQLRGQFGEQVAEDLLKMAGFVKGQDYQVNTKQKTTSTRPDFAVFFPDGAKIHIDVKFPYLNLQKAAETVNKHEKKQYLKLFRTDVKEKINQITGRDYINPEEKTVDFVILFVPNEMIFSYIYEKMSDIWVDAMKKKVVLAGPFSFTAILRMIRQAYDNFQYQKNIRQIITYIKLFEKEFGKYNEEFVKIGSLIDRVENQYQKVERTRTKQLLRVVDKIKVERLPEGEKL